MNSALAPLPAIASGRLAVQRFRWSQLSRHPTPKPTHPRETPAAADSCTPTAIPNPFLPHFNPSSQRWAGPQLSLRQQALLVKRARTAGLLHLLPPGPKASIDEIRASAQRITTLSPESGPTGPPIEWLPNHRPPPVSGNLSSVPRLFLAKKRLFKGHKWQRALAKRKAQLAVRARDMDRRIHRWRMVCPSFPSPLPIFTLALTRTACATSGALSPRPNRCQAQSFHSKF
jgi:large subunit ribosomal protein L25